MVTKIKSNSFYKLLSWTFLSISLFSLISMMGCTTYPGVTDEERNAVRQELGQKRLEYYYDQMTRVTAIGCRLLAVESSKNTNDSHLRLPILYANVNQSIQTSGYDYLPKKSVMVIDVLPNLIKKETQIKRGDQIIAINDKAVQSEGDIESLIKNLGFQKKVPVRFRRGITEWSEELPIIFLERNVNFAIDGKTASVNAYTDSWNLIVVTTPMLRFAGDDNNLAFVLGHEIGHIAAGHWIKMRAAHAGGAYVGSTVGQAIDQFAPGVGSLAGAITQAIVTAPFSQEMEETADGFGLKYMKRAGFDVQKAPNFFKRMAVEIPKTQKFSIIATHPATPERLNHLNHLIDETTSQT